MFCTYAERLFTLQVKNNLNSCLFLHVSLQSLGTTASLVLRNNLGKTPGSFQNGLGKRLEVFVGKVAPKMQPISVAMSWGLSGRDSWERVEEILYAMLRAIFEILQHEASLLGIHGWHLQKS